MITINLVPTREKKRRLQLLLAAYIGAGVVVFFGVLGFAFVQKKKEQSELRRQIAEVDARIKDLESIVQEVRAMEAQKKQVTDLESDFQKVRAQQKKILKSLDVLALVLPDGVWFTRVLQDTADPEVWIVEGRALNDLSLRRYVENLKAPDSGFQDVTFKVSAVSDTYTFEIRVKMTDKGGKT